MQFINHLEAKAQELGPQLEAANKVACTAFTHMHSPLHIPLMKYITGLANIEDKELPEKLLSGLPIVGVADESPFFQPYDLPAKMSLEDFLKSAPDRRNTLMDKIVREAKTTPAKVLNANHAKTLEEVEAGTMGPALTPAEFEKKYGRLCKEG